MWSILRWYINICLEEVRRYIETSSPSQDSQPSENNFYLGPSKYKTTQLQISAIPKFTANNVNIWQTHTEDSNNHTFKVVDDTYLDGFPLHTHTKALLVAAVLTSVALALINCTVLVFPACVWQVLSHRSLEKTLAPFTAETKNTEILGKV